LFWTNNNQIKIDKMWYIWNGEKDKRYADKNTNSITAGP